MLGFGLCGSRSGISFRVFVHAVEEVFNSHLGGLVPYRRESQAHFFCWPLDSLRGEDVEEAGGEAQCSVKDAVYLCELSVSEVPEVCGMVFGLE